MVEAVAPSEWLAIAEAARVTGWNPERLRSLAGGEPSPVDGAIAGWRSWWRTVGHARWTAGRSRTVGRPP